jgi:hypothetical protein
MRLIYFYKTLFLISIFTFFLFACNEGISKKETVQIDTVKTERSQLAKPDEDSIKVERLKKLGGVTLASMDKPSKCNLTKGKYILNKIITDSSDIAFVVEYLGNQIFELGIDNKETDCPYPVMCIVYLYMNKQDFKINDNVASYSVTPASGVDVYVNTRKLSEFK